MIKKMFGWQPVSEGPFLATRGKLPSNSPKNLICFLFFPSFNKPLPSFSQVGGQGTSQNSSLTVCLMTVFNQTKALFPNSQKQRTTTANCDVSLQRQKEIYNLPRESGKRSRGNHRGSPKVQLYSFAICHNHCHSPKAALKNETGESAPENLKKK